MQHSWQNEPDAAEGARCLTLQCFPNAGIFLQHLGCHGGSGFVQCNFEVGHRHTVRIEASAECRQSGSADEVFEIRTGKPIGAPRQRFQIDVLVERHVAGVNGENPPASGSVGGPT